MNDRRFIVAIARVFDVPVWLLAPEDKEACWADEHRRFWNEVDRRPKAFYG